MAGLAIEAAEAGQGAVGASSQLPDLGLDLGCKAVHESIVVRDGPMRTCTETFLKLSTRRLLILNIAYNLHRCAAAQHRRPWKPRPLACKGDAVGLRLGCAISGIRAGRRAIGETDRAGASNIERTQSMLAHQTSEHLRAPHGVPLHDKNEATV